MAIQSKTQAVYRQTHLVITRILRDDEAAVRSNLANLRKGVGYAPGDLPSLWGILLADLPADMLGRYGNPSKEEWAIYTAITLYALHQQGSDPKSESIFDQGIGMSLGTAASKLVAKEGGDDDARERVARRFNQIALASDMPTLSYYLRGFIQLLRSADIALDYSLLARDLYLYQFEDGAKSVRLQWGQDFYSTRLESKGKDD